MKSGVMNLQTNSKHDFTAQWDKNYFILKYKLLTNIMLCMDCAVISARLNQIMSVKCKESSKVTASALALISIAFIAIGSGCLGLGMSRRFLSVGTGLVPYLVGYLCFVLGVGTLVLSVPFGIISTM